MPVQDFIEKFLESYFEKKKIRNIIIQGIDNKGQILKENQEEELLFKVAKFKNYQDIKTKLEFDYDRLNPLTKSKAEKNWRDSRITLSQDDFEDCFDNEQI